MEAAGHVSLSASGMGVALFPVLSLAVLARVFDQAELGTLTLSLAVGTFAGQVAAAGIVESRLASSSAAARHARMPYWLSALGAAGAATIAVAPFVGVVTVALPFLMCALLVGRTVGVTEGLHVRESIAAAAIIASSLTALAIAGTLPHVAMATLVAGPLVALICRLPRRGTALPLPDRRALGWVTLDAATSGLTSPYLNALLLAMLGPAAAISYRAVSNVSAAVEPLITVARLRLLKSHSAIAYWTSSALVALAVAAAVACEFLGVFDLILGPAWADVTLWMLLLALSSRVVAMLTTPYFAELRRSRRVAHTYWLRLTSTCLYLVFGTVGALFWSVSGALAGMIVAEITTLVIFRSVARRLRSSLTQSLASTDR